MCVRTKTMNMGARKRTDSFTPRAFNTTRRTIRKIDEAYLVVVKAMGRKLKRASAQETRETVMVSI